MAAVQVRGLREFRTELRKADASLSNEMRKVHRRISDLVAARAKSAMPRAQSAIKPRATNSSAFIETVAKPPYALGVIWGMKRRSGWYSNPRYSGSTGRQFEPWVGNQWEPGDHGGKPYYIGDAINSSLDEVEEMYMDGIDDLARRAFPN